MKFFVLIIATLILLGCSNHALIKQNKPSPVEKINKGLIDTSKVDTTNWASDYDNFIKKVNPTNRNFKDINEILQKNSDKIINYCNTYANKLKIKTIDTVRFSLSYDGSLMISSINSKYLTDTIELRVIINMFKNIQADFSKEGKYYCWFSVIMRNDGASQELKLNPTIDYGEKPRTKLSILRTVMKNIGNLRKLYNKRLLINPSLSGMITLKFTINQYGQIISVKKESSTLSDELFNNAILQQIQHWKFDSILIKDDVTEVTYPFAFSPQ